MTRHTTGEREMGKYQQQAIEIAHSVAEGLRAWLSFVNGEKRMVKDPICGMTIDEKTAAGKS